MLFRSVDLKGYLIEGSHYFQLRDLSASLKVGNKDFSIVWDAPGNRVVIDTSRGYDPNEQYKPQTTETPAPNTSAIKDRIILKDRTNGNGTAFDIETIGDAIPGKLANGKDITEANIAAMFAELQAVFPDGTSWGDGKNGTYYSYWSGIFGSGGACNSWAYMTADLLFGKGATYTMHNDLTKVKAGDVVWLKDANNKGVHWFVVRGMATSVSGNSQILSCDGNSNGEVIWGQKATQYTAMNNPNSIVYSFYN